MTEIIDAPAFVDLSAPKAQEKSVETEAEVGTKRKLYDVLRPPDEDAQRITSRIGEVAGKEMGDPPNTEVKKIFEAASGILLWLNGMNDTGNFLPNGLVFRDTPLSYHTSWSDIEIDTNVLTMQDNNYVMDIFKREGILDELSAIRKQHRESRRDEIANGIADYFRDSQLMDYLGIFGVSKVEDRAEKRLEPGSVAWQRRRSELHAEFVEAHGALPGREADPALWRLYQRDVQMPLRQSTIQTEDEDKDTSDQQKSMLRKYIASNYFAHSGLANSEREQQRVIVHDGEFLFPQVGPTGNLTFVKDDKEWNGKEDAVPLDIFSNREIYNSGPHLGLLSYGNRYQREALVKMLPRLYDPKNEKSFQEIVDECIEETSREIADLFVDEKFLLLDDVPPYGLLGDYNPDDPDVRSQMVRLIWLTDITKSPYGKHNIRDLRSKNFHTEELHIENSEDEVHRGDVLYAKPEVFTDVPARIITYRSRETDLPRVPADVDLCIRFSDLQMKVRGRTSTWLSMQEATLAEWDPYIPGMDLVARADDLCYFRISEEENDYRPMEELMEPLKMIQIRAFCDRLGMHNLAKTLSAQESVTASQFVDLAREHFVLSESVPHGALTLNNPQDLVDLQLVDDFEGKMRGNRVIFEYFIRAMLKMGFDTKIDIIDSSISSVSGDGLTPDGIQAGNYAQTGVSYKREYYLLDPLVPTPAVTESRRKEKVNEYDDYADRPTTISVPSLQEWREQLGTTIGKVEVVKPEVFEGTDTRLVQIADRNTILPSTAEEYDLLVTMGQEIANHTSDPYITGLKLVARDGARCYFQLDKDKNDYAPAGKEIPPEKKQEVMWICEDLGMDDLARVLRGDGSISVATFVNRARESMKGYVPQEHYSAEHQSIYDLLEKGQIDDEGNLRGTPELFNYFLRSMLMRLYGEDAVKQVRGYALQKNETAIVGTMHEQTSLRILARTDFPEESIDCLLSVEPDERDADYASGTFKVKSVRRFASFGDHRPLRPGQQVTYPEGFEEEDFPSQKRFRNERRSRSGDSGTGKGIPLNWDEDGEDWDEAMMKELEGFGESSDGGRISFGDRLGYGSEADGARQIGDVKVEKGRRLPNFLPGRRTADQGEGQEGAMLATQVLTALAEKGREASEGEFGVEMGEGGDVRLVKGLLEQVRAGQITTDEFVHAASMFQTNAVPNTKFLKELGQELQRLEPGQLNSLLNTLDIQPPGASPGRAGEGRASVQTSGAGSELGGGISGEGSFGNRGEGGREISLSEYLRRVRDKEIPLETFLDEFDPSYLEGENIAGETGDKLRELLWQLKPEQLNRILEKVMEAQNEVTPEAELEPYDDDDEDESLTEMLRSLKDKYKSLKDIFRKMERGERKALRKLRKEEREKLKRKRGPDNQVTLGGKQEFEKNVNTHIGEILWCDENIFADTGQRLIRRRKRDPGIVAVAGGQDGETSMVLDGAEVALKVMDPKLADASHDPYIYGMRLIGRNDKDGIYYYRREKKDVYKNVDKAIPQRKLVDEAQICSEIGMPKLTHSIMGSEDVTVSGLLDLDREHVVWDLPDIEEKEVAFNSRKDLVEEGLIDEGVVYGDCQILEFFVRDQMGGIYGSKTVSRVGGYSLNRSKFISAAGHAQTLLNVPQEGIYAVLDVEPDPAKTETKIRRDNRDAAPVLANSSEGDFEQLIKSVIEGKEEEAKTFSIPKPDDEVDDLTVYVEDPDTGQYTKKVTGEDARKILDESSDKREDELRVREEFNAVRLMYEKALLGYLGLPIVTDSFEMVDTRIHDTLRSDLHKGAAHWRTIPHVLLFSFIREFERGKEDHSGSGKMSRNDFTVSEDDITLAEELLQTYKDAPNGTVPRYGNRQLPPYNDNFIRMFGKVVAVCKDVNRIGGIGYYL